jgi:tRNA pseudouridine38-40 synthase
MPRYKLTIEYDGRPFVGWQIQDNGPSVQGVLAGAVEAFCGEEVSVHGAGRTDAGVHARGQVASFRHATTLPAKAFPPLLCRELPRDMRVVGADERPDSFHARHSALARRYAYHLLSAPDLLEERYAWAPGRSLPLAALQESAEPLNGWHDCSAFQAVGSSPADPRCHILHARWEPRPDGARFDVMADHFLYHMVRNLVGTSLDAAASGDPAAHMRAVLESRDRSRGGVTAPPEGLSLESVAYEGALA